MAISGISWSWLVAILFSLVFASVNIANRLHETPIYVHDGQEYSEDGYSDISVIREKILGTWLLESYELKIHGPVTITRYPLSSNAIGLLTYTPDGYMSANLMQPGFERFNKVSYHLGSDKEMAEAAKHNLAYAGTYSLGITSDFKTYINHSVETSLFSNWLGTNQTRLLNLDYDHLTLLPDELPTYMGMQVEAILKWKRAIPRS